MVVEPFEVVLPIRPIKNPVPFLAPEGDCGPCALCAAVGWSAERIPDIYHMAGRETPQGLTSFEIMRVLHALQWQHELIEYVDEPILPHTDDHYPGPWGYPGWTLADSWFDMLRLRLQSGWVGLTTVDFDGRGPVIPQDGRLFKQLGGNHWVLLTGARARWVEHGNSTGLESAVCVADSSTRRPDEWWCEVDEFLLRYGGFRVIWLRRRR